MVKVLGDQRVQQLLQRRLQQSPTGAQRSRRGVTQDKRSHVTLPAAAAASLPPGVRQPAHVGELPKGVAVPRVKAFKAPLSA